MASQVPNYSGAGDASPASRGFSWSGIFAGTFLFIVIEVTFGMLGWAAFAPAVTATSGTSMGAMSLGGGLWMIFLSMIAMFFAARLASKISGATTRGMGLSNGLVTFGMSIFTTILVLALALGTTTSGTAAGMTASSSMGTLLAEAGYWLFIALFLGFVGSMAGGAQGAQQPLRPRGMRNPQNTSNQQAA